MTLKSKFSAVVFFPLGDFRTSIGHLCHRGKQFKVGREKSKNTVWGSVGGWGMIEQRATREATYRLEVADAIKGQSEGTGARRDTAEDGKSKRDKKRKAVDRRTH